MADAHEDLVRQRFGPRATAYVHSAVHATGEDLEWLERLAAQLRPAHALDLGSGGGHVAYRLARHAQEVTAFDLSEQMVAAVLATAQDRGIANIAGRVGAVEHLPFQADSFDMVATRFSAHHWRDVDAGLREARRVLAPGGKALFIDAVAPDATAADMHLQAIELLRDPSHLRDYRIGEWVAALGRAGFTVRSIRSLRLRMEFDSWTARMATPAPHVAAIRSLQQLASADVASRLAIEPDGSFLLDTAMIEAD